MSDTLILTRDDLAQLFTLDDYIAAVEHAFAAHARGESLTPTLMHVDGIGGEFHVKAGGLIVGERTYFGLKANGGFFQNPTTLGLPAIQGMIYLADATNGSPLAIMDSLYITMQRTGAATAVAARYCARTDATVATVCGAGRQGRVQLTALTKVRTIRAAYVWSPHYDAAERYAREMSNILGIEIAPIVRIEDGTRQSDIVVTCTPAREPFVRADALRPGTFVAAVGADSPDKQELDVAVLASAHKVVTDLTAQCQHVGELHHAITAGRMTAGDVHGEIGEVITGARSGRERDDEIIVFDSTGTALQDVACAAAIYERASAIQIGTAISLT